MTDSTPTFTEVAAGGGTTPPQQGGTAPMQQGDSGGSQSRAADVARSAAGSGRDVATTGLDEAKSVAAVAADRAATVGGQAVDQARTVVDSVTGDVRDQLDQRLRTLASAARERADELEALLDGRPEDAGRTRDLAQSAQGHLAHLADRADELGIDGVLREASDLARRRPVLFLAGAATAGLLVGRMARAGREVSGADDDRTDGANQLGSNGAPGAPTAPSIDLTTAPGTATSTGAPSTSPGPTSGDPQATEPGTTAGWVGTR